MNENINELIVSKTKKILLGILNLAQAIENIIIKATKNNDSPPKK